MTIARIREYLDLIKFSHTLFALPFALLGAALAAHGRDGWHGRVQDWVGILLCMATARSAAMAFNRLADRHYDALNPRTAGRHLPAGLLSVRSVAVFTLVCSLAFVAVDAAVPAQPLAVVPLRPRAALAAGIFLQQAVHQPGSFLAGCLAEPGADRGLDRPARRPRMASGLAGAGRAALGVGVRHHLRLPGRRIRPDGRACAACPRRLGFAAPSGSRPPATP